VNSLKKAEITKCNELARMACVYFSHFSFLYAQAKDRKNENAVPLLEERPLPEIINVFCSEPDESQYFFFFVSIFLYLFRLFLYFFSFPFSFSILRPHN
jgi:hypothetical protein